jgi:hypothetical protein
MNQGFTNLRLEDNEEDPKLYTVIWDQSNIITVISDQMGVIMGRSVTSVWMASTNLDPISMLLTLKASMPPTFLLGGLARLRSYSSSFPGYMAGKAADLRAMASILADCCVLLDACRCGAGRPSQFHCCPLVPMSKLIIGVGETR